MRPPWMLVDYYTRGSYPTERAGSLTEDQQTNKLKSIMSPVLFSHLPALTLKQRSPHNNLSPSLGLSGRKDSQPSWGATPGRMEPEWHSFTIPPWPREQSPQHHHAGVTFYLHWVWVTHKNQLLSEKEKTSIHSFSDKTKELRGWCGYWSCSHPTISLKTLLCPAYVIIPLSEYYWIVWKLFLYSLYLILRTEIPKATTTLRILQDWQRKRTS